MVKSSISRESSRKTPKSLETITQELAENLSSIDGRELEEYLPQIHIKLGVVKKTAQKNIVYSVEAYPSIDIEVSKAVSYTVNSRGIRKKDGTPLFYDWIYMKGNNGEKVRIKGHYGDLSGLMGILERLYLAVMIVFRPEIVSKKGLNEKNTKYNDVMQLFADYNQTLEHMRMLVENSPSLAKKTISFYEVRGNDLLEMIKAYRIKI